jgi:ABC-type bacteriocin/lantibiotic exporter with double-glycine peptidase domain
MIDQSLRRTQRERPTSGLRATFAFGQYVARLSWADPSVLRWLLVTSVLQSVVELAGPWLSGKVIDVALPHRSPRLLLALVLLLLLASICVQGIGWMRSRTLLVLFKRLEATSLSDVLSRILGRDFERAQNDTFAAAQETLQTASRGTVMLAGAALAALTQSAGAGIALVFMALWFPWLAVLTMAAGLAMALVAATYSSREIQLAKVNLDASCRQQEALYGLMRSLPSLRAFGATRDAVRAWRELLSAETRASALQGDTQVSRNVVLGSIPLLLNVAATGWLASAILDEGTRLGEMMMGLMLMNMVLGAFAELTHQASAIYAMAPYFGQLHDLVGDAVGRQEPYATSARPAKSCDLVLDRVWFRYPGAAGDVWALEGCCERFAEGKLTLLRGPSGSGKTTQLRLLAGLIEPHRGRVRVLGRDPRGVRESILYLPQESTLLQASIAVNLEVFSGRSLDAAWEVAEHTGLAAWLEQLPMGVDTLLSSGGGNLSAGQRQLILLTAAFASSRSVILLDEPTSQIDTTTKSAIDWSALARGRSVVIVCHE